MKRQSPFGETIFALSTGRLPSGVAVVRVSGNRVTDVVERLCGGIPPARKAVLRTITDRNGVKIDQGLIVFFPGPQSFTGEDCAEFHLHGGRAVVSALLGELGSSNGLRGAEAGEFTMRAFFNGKIDLTGAEALSDLIAAETETQRRMAIENAGGRQSALYESWRTRIIHAQAMIEAELDFSDEEDVPGSVASETWSEIAALIGEVKAHISEYHRAEIIRDGFRVAIIGAPNVGKSTLLNALARRDVAIVSDEPGTTRDVISVTLDLGGIAVVISDTAGIRAQPGTIEALGIERSFSTARDADLVLLLRCNGQVQQLEEPADTGKTLRIVTKSDLNRKRSDHETGELVLSSKTGEGIDRLLDEIEEKARNAIGAPLDTLPSRQRHIDDLNAVTVYLAEAGDDKSGGLEIRAEALRLAANRLGRLTGHIDVEDVLDVVFGTFCIGK